jgi:hypothetical protein
MHNTALLSSWNTINEVKRAMDPGAPPATYSELYTFLVKQAKTHDIAIPFKRSTHHAHKANFDSVRDDSNERDDDEESVLDEVLAHMSVQNEPMSEDTVMHYRYSALSKDDATVQLVRENQKQKYHLKSTEMYLGN